MFLRAEENEYAAFGLSGSDEEARMEGADAAIIYMDGFQGNSKDYNLTAKSTVRGRIY